jgi:hypothetical protein
MDEQHWATNENSQRAINAARGQYNLSAEDTKNALGITESYREYTGTLEEAINDLRMYALDRLFDAADRDVEPANHSEAMVVAWTNVTTTTGQQINVTARQGAGHNDIVKTVVELKIALEILSADLHIAN